MSILEYEKIQRNFLALQKQTGGGPPPTPPTPPHPDSLSIPNSKYDLLPVSFSSQVSFPDPPVLSIPDPVLGLKQPVKDILSSVCDEVFDDSFTPALLLPTPLRPPQRPPAATATAPASAPAPAPDIESSASEAAPAPATNRTSVCSKTKSSKSSSPDPLAAEALATMKRKAEIIGKLYSCYINYSQMLYIKLILNFS